MLKTPGAPKVGAAWTNGAAVGIISKRAKSEVAYDVPPTKRAEMAKVRVRMNMGSISSAGKEDTGMVSLKPEGNK